ncbi:MAG TPA: adenosylmethionine decarboxylase [Candidatus Cloacimonadota bacterium]|nr:adenosylmethionine decarboxylase [Candidatus Cloacimonadota bacterium]HPT71712.1 adenosylmethionine decarboxylase [Candidatus Cloacimonadota bacterium]
MQALGRQILVEYYDCNPDILKNVQIIEKAMVDACNMAQATVVTQTFHEFSPFGVSGVVVIAESHVAIHTWPEYRYAAVDIFTCGETIQPWILFEHLKKILDSKHYSNMELKRGLFDLGDKKLQHKPDMESTEQPAIGN